MRIAITGAGGLLGTALVDALPARFTVFAAGRDRGFSPANVTWDMFDLLSPGAIEHWLETHRPDVVVQSAALVNVDACETRRAEAEALHQGTTSQIARTLTKWGGRIVYISTDAVFDGQKTGPYTEEDTTNPLNVYGQTKYLGELATLASPGGLVLRTNIFGWSRVQRLSFAEWLLKGLVEGSPLNLFTDVRYTPIHVTHLAGIVADLIAGGEVGLFHATGSMALSKYDFGILLAEAFGLSTQNVTPASVEQAGLKAARPRNMVLANQKLRAVPGLSVPGAIEGVRILKEQYDEGWLADIKGRPMPGNYHFWE